MATKYFSSVLFLAALFFTATALFFPSPASAQRRVPPGLLKQVEQTVNQRQQGKQTETPTATSPTQTATPSSGVIDTLPEALTVKETGVFIGPAKENQEIIIARYLDDTLVVWKDTNGQLILTIHWTRQIRQFLLIILVTLPFVLFWKKALRYIKRKRRYKVKRIEL